MLARFYGAKVHVIVITHNNIRITQENLKIMRLLQLSFVKWIFKNSLEFLFCLLFQKSNNATQNSMESNDLIVLFHLFVIRHSHFAPQALLQNLG
jgi:hypothetical protein